MTDSISIASSLRKGSLSAPKTILSPFLNALGWGLAIEPAIYRIRKHGEPFVDHELGFANVQYAHLSFEAVFGARAASADFLGSRRARRTSNFFERLAAK